MKLHLNLEIPMGCPAPGCEGTDFYILMSHPFGDQSEAMWVQCNGCGRRFYTNEGVPAAAVRSLVTQLKGADVRGPQ